MLWDWMFMVNISSDCGGEVASDTYVVADMIVVAEVCTVAWVYLTLLPLPVIALTLL